MNLSLKYNSKKIFCPQTYIYIHIYVCVTRLGKNSLIADWVKIEFFPEMVSTKFKYFMHKI